MITVMLNDAGKEYTRAEGHFQDAGRWARANCESFRGYQVVDVADVSPNHDLIATYRFGNDADAVMFQLRWGG